MNVRTIVDVVRSVKRARLASRSGPGSCVRAGYRKAYELGAGRHEANDIRKIPDYTLHVLAGIFAIAFLPWLTAGRAGRHGFEGD